MLGITVHCCEDIVYSIDIVFILCGYIYIVLVVLHVQLFDITSSSLVNPHLPLASSSGQGTAILAATTAPPSVQGGGTPSPEHLP